MIALGFRALDPKAKPDPSLDKPALIPAPGDPLLLVCVLNLQDSGQAGQPLLAVETAPGPPDKKGARPLYDRLAINSNGMAGEFKVLLLPYRQGEMLPKVAYQASGRTASIDWPGEADKFLFTTGDDQRTRVTIQRAGKTLVKSK
jgi:hypothetical protein